MSSPVKSFFIKDILSNQCKVISDESNKTKDLLSKKSFYHRYYFNAINLPVLVLKETPGKSNIGAYSLIHHWTKQIKIKCLIEFYLDTLDQDLSSQLTREFRKRRKTRAAFSTYQISELENRFSHQRYLTPPDRDQIAKELRLSPAQVITVSFCCCLFHSIFK